MKIIIEKNLIKKIQINNNILRYELKFKKKLFSKLYKIYFIS